MSFKLFVTIIYMVPEMGLEPIWISPFDFKSNAYTNSAIRASLRSARRVPRGERASLQFLDKIEVFWIFSERSAVIDRTSEEKYKRADFSKNLEAPFCR